MTYLKFLLSFCLGVAMSAGIEARSTAPASVAAAGSQGKTVRQAVLEVIKSRPKDPWPRGEGHVVLGLPGSADNQKAYHEPGGSFSPGLGSFGISLWVLDAQGQLRTSSDQIPIDRIQQQWVWRNDREIPGILTDTPDYQVAWHGSGDGRWWSYLSKYSVNCSASV